MRARQGRRYIALILVVMLALSCELRADTTAWLIAAPLPAPSCDATVKATAIALTPPRKVEGQADLSGTTGQGALSLERIKHSLESDVAQPLSRATLSISLKHPSIGAPSKPSFKNGVSQRTNGGGNGHKIAGAILIAAGAALILGGTNYRHEAGQRQNQCIDAAGKKFPLNDPFASGQGQLGAALRACSDNYDHDSLTGSAVLGSGVVAAAFGAVLLLR